MRLITCLTIIISLTVSHSRKVGGYNEMSTQQLQSLGQELSTNGQTVQVKSGFQQLVNGTNYAVVLNHSSDANDCYVMFNLITYLPTHKITLFDSAFANHATLKAAQSSKPSNCDTTVLGALEHSYVPHIELIQKVEERPKVLGGYSIMSEEQRTTLEALISNEQHHVKIGFGYQQVVNGINYALSLTSELSEDPCLYVANLIAYTQPNKIAVFSSNFPPYAVLQKGMDNLQPCPQLMDLSIRALFDSNPLSVLGGYNIMGNQDLERLNKRFSTEQEPFEFIKGYNQVVNGMNYAVVVKSQSHSNPCFEMMNIVAYLNPQKITLIEGNDNQLLRIGLGGLEPCSMQMRYTMGVNFGALQPSPTLQIKTNPLDIQVYSPYETIENIQNKEQILNHNEILGKSNETIFEYQELPIMNLELVKIKEFGNRLAMGNNLNSWREIRLSEFEKVKSIFKSSDFEGNISSILMSNQNKSYLYVFTFKIEDNTSILGLKLDLETKELSLLNQTNLEDSKYPERQKYTLWDTQKSQELLPNLQSEVEHIFFIQPPVLDQWNLNQSLEFLSLTRFTHSKEHKIQISEDSYTRPTQTHNDMLFVVHNENKDQVDCVMIVQVANDSLNYPIFLNAAEDNTWQQIFKDTPPCAIERINTFRDDFNAKLIQDKETLIGQYQTNDKSLLGGSSVMNTSALTSVDQILQAKYPNYTAKVGIVKIMAGADYIVILQNSETQQLCVVNFSFIVLSQKPKLTVKALDLLTAVQGSFADVPQCSADMFTLFEDDLRILI